MKRPSYSEIQAALTAERLSGLPPLRIAILRNVVIETIEPYLRYHGLTSRRNVECRFGAYDNVVQEAVGAAPELLNVATDCVLVITRLEGLAWDLARNFASLDREGMAAERARIASFIDQVLTGIRRQTQAMIVWTSFEQPAYPALGIADAQSGDGQLACIAELNRTLADALRTQRSAYVLDLNTCLARIGASNFYDQRYWHIGRSPYARAALEEIGHELWKFVRPGLGQTRKCLVLDCDNVLWGGVVGEDGLAGIKLGRTYPGSAYFELQQEIVNLHHRGVVLALCSKNNAADVWEVFDRHPDMLLRREHIAAARINWQDKATNLAELAAELNLGLDSFVFLDDSPFEVDHIAQRLPEVEAILLPPGEAVDFRDRVTRGGWFDTPSISQEDRQRGAMYQAEASRRVLMQETTDLAGYLRSLGMVLEIRRADALSTPRVAQLTQKTNQFNLTTRRYTETEIEALCADASADVVHIRLKDRFGDSGITGVCILSYEGHCARIDAFLLSCRVLGRGVEDAFLVECLRTARQRGCRSVLGSFVPTAKNGQVENFYARHGFLAAGGEPPTRRYELDLNGFAARTPDFFERIDSNLAPERATVPQS